ncbi:MAG: TonB-dependent receptor [Myxococcales bacterium]|nr:TonB-dependent receptor [Myxococcales bacterium]
MARTPPALQLSTLLDIEAVNVLRGPQGTGPARNASAGAIKIYSRKPTGEFDAYLRSELGNFDFRDYEGAIEAPIVEDILAGRFAFRFSERDGTMKNRCADAVPLEDRVASPTLLELGALQKLNSDPPWSQCGEAVVPRFISDVPVGLPSRLNDIGNWAARGTLLFQPTLDMSWLLNAHGSRRDEWSRVGQSIGTRGQFCADGDIDNCGFLGQASDAARILGLLGGTQGIAAAGYRPPEIQKRLEQLAPCNIPFADNPFGDCGKTDNRAGVSQAESRAIENAAKIRLAKELAKGLDSDPWAGDFNLCGLKPIRDGEEIVGFVDRELADDGSFAYGTGGDLISGSRCNKDKGRTTNDTWGGFLKGEIVLPWGLQLDSVTGFDTYDRLLDIDLDFSPETLFEVRTDDDGWQLTQDLRLRGQLGAESGLRWDISSWFLRERLNVVVTNDLGKISIFAVGERDYTQDLWSAAGSASLAFDFWGDFTLDGGFRYNWEQKKLDYTLTQGAITNPFVQKLNDTWHAPTGTVRLTWRFREDTHVFWKYTRGWKPGTYNATSSLSQGVSVADPEVIDSFETGLRGSWFDGLLGLDFSFFYYAYQDYQLFTAQQFAGGQPEFVILNADGAEVYGAEVDAVARPWYGAFANVRFGWLESQFLDFVQLQQETINPQGTQVTINRELQNTGNRLLNSPEFKVSLTAEQTLSLGRWGSVTARYDGVWTETTFYDATEGRGIPNVDNIEFLPENTVAQPSFWLHNLRFSYGPRSGRWEIAGWVRNLTNENYKTFGFDASTFSQTSIYFVGEPRTYGGTLNISF